MKQMTPSSYPKRMKSENFGTLQLTQTWNKYGSCPDGTIPIRRKGKNNKPIPLGEHNRLKALSYETHDTSKKDDIPENHEYATISVDGNFLGAQAKINLWKPVTEAQEMSISQIWVAAGDINERNTIEAGWAVDQDTYGDDRTRFFIYWTADGYNNTGCGNLMCEGFVQTTSDICLGGDFTDVSTLNGDQKDASFNIHKDESNGHWWVQLQGIPVGYYPSSLFTTLSKTAKKVIWGGEIYNGRSKGRHTSTQMGSGHFPSEGELKTSSYFSWVKVVDEDNVTKDPKFFYEGISNPNCYDLKIDNLNYHTNGFSFYYGGPGYNDKCQ
ncbi:hypothetical protein MKW98_009679 [Papaver atlanticum]|uniref:Neprosin PEP catalytic domain-containing protein n=1 Tax=Papaver atlanticum TaxID=357466 RepID=A0AAD4SXF1_9MAGN|nr:hypothetical protein MKW98_009679 [Papaver atlanticum]